MTDTKTQPIDNDSLTSMLQARKAILKKISTLYDERNDLIAQCRRKDQDIDLALGLLSYAEQRILTKQEQQAEHTKQ